MFQIQTKNLKLKACYIGLLLLSFMLVGMEADAQTAVCQDASINTLAYSPGQTYNYLISVSDIDNGSSGYQTLGIAMNANDPGSQTLTGFCSTAGGTLTVYLIAVDNNSNDDICSATVTLVDNNGPYIDCSNAVLSLDNTGMLTPTPGDFAIAYDECSAGSLSFTSGTAPTYSCGSTGYQSINLTATDGNSNSSTLTCSVLIEDDMPPTANCQNINAYLDATGNYSFNANDINDSSTDNCSLNSLSLSTNNFNCNDLGPNNVTLTVTDGSGNSSTCVAVVSVFDNIAPTLTTYNTTEILDANGSYTLVVTDVTGSSSYHDNCTNDADLTFSFDNDSFDCDDLGTTTMVELTVTDASLNSSSQTAMVTIWDFNAPTASCVQDVTVEIDANGIGTLTPAMVDDNSTDNCGVTNMFLSQTAFNCTQIGSVIPVTLWVYDDRGNGLSNSDNCTVMVHVEDNINPIITPADITIDWDDHNTLPLTAGQLANITDNCGFSNISLSQDIFDCTDVGTTVVSITVTDNSGNSATANVNVTVEDLVDPVANAITNGTAYIGSSGTVTLNPFYVDNGSSDNCGIMSYSVSPNNFTCADVGTSHTVTLTVTDEHGNTDSASSSIFIDDNEDPTAVCQPITAMLDATGNVTVMATELDNGSTDNCMNKDTMMSLTQNGGYMTSMDFDCSDIGAPIDIWMRVRDDQNNKDKCMTTITIAAANMPTAIAQDITLDLDATGNVMLIPNQIDNGSSGTCGVALTASKTNFNCTEVGVHSVTLTVMDALGNTATDVAMVTIQDVMDPSITCVPFNATLDASGSFTLTANDIVSASSDNCSSSSNIILSKTSFTCADIGPHLVTASITDPQGNVASCTSTVTIFDNAAPVLDCQTNVVVELDPMHPNGFVFLEIEPSHENEQVETIDFGTMTSLPTNYDVIASPGISIAAPTAGANESVVGATLTFCTETDNGDFDERIEFTYTDPLSGATKTIIVGDDTGDCEIDCKTIYILSSAVVGTSISNVTAKTLGNQIDLGVCSMHEVSVAYGLLLDTDLDPYFNTIPSDNCNGNGLELSFSPNEFDCGDPATMPLTITLTDAGGNPTSCSTTAEIKHTPLAVIQQNLPPFYLDGNTGTFTLQTSMVDAGSTVACDPLNVSVSPTTFDCSAVGVPQQVTLTVTNTAGDVSTATTTINIEVLPGTDPCGTACDDNLELDNNPITNGEYRVDDWIKSAGTIDGSPTSNDVIFYAPNEITLEPGFEIMIGSEVLIDIKGCLD